MDTMLTREKPPFEQLYRRYWSALLFYAQRKVGSREEAEDLVADTFAYCLEHYDRYDPEKSAVSTWLYLVLNSRIKNYYRDRKETVDIGALEGVLESEGEELEQSIWLEQLRAAMTQAIGKLPERQQQAVILRYFKEKSSAEIGEILGITPGNARVLLSRALDKLQEELGGIAQFQGSIY